MRLLSFAALLLLMLGAMETDAFAPQNMNADNMETYGIPPMAVPMMKCTACERAMRKLQSTLSKYIVNDVQWNKSTKKKVWKEIKDLCMDKDIFPSTSKEELYLKACAILMRDHYKQIMGAIRRRLSPESDLYEEDIVVGSFCREIGGCPEGVISMDEALNKPADPNEKKQQESNAEL